MNKGRIETVAYALATSDERYEPGYAPERYAVLKINREGRDLHLDSIGPGVLCDIAAWTCYSYPDMCDVAGEKQGETIQGLWYWRNAKAILGLTEDQADALFLTQIPNENSCEAAMRLRSFAGITAPKVA